MKLPIAVLTPDDASTRQLTEPMAQASSGADGRYGLTGFLPGRYILIAGYPLPFNGERAQSFAASIDIPGVDVQTLDFSLEDRGGYSIRGKVSMDGTPYMPADLRLSVRVAWPSPTTRQGGDAIASSYDPKSGTFEIPGLYPGLYEISVNLMDRPEALGRCASATAVVPRADVSAVDLMVRPCL